MARKKSRLSRKNRKKRKQSDKKQLSIETLDSRQILDASGALNEVIAGPDASSIIDQEAQSISQALIQASSQAEQAMNGTGRHSDSIRHELVFIDAGVADQDVLISDIMTSRPGLLREVVLLEADSDGLLQIAGHLSGRTDIDAIHVISHGEQAELRLGDAVISQDELQSDYGDAMATIRGALSEDADLLIYGCNFGGGDDGVDAVTTLSELTGADVAASDDLTGAEDKGGDWVLETTVGDIDSQALVSQNFTGVLMDTDGDGIDDVDDLDKDGDGILDTEEGFVPATTTAIDQFDLNTPGFPVDTPLQTGNTAQLNGLLGGLLDFSAELINAPGGSNPGFTGGVQIDANATLGDFIFVQPNGLGGFPADNATYTFDFNNPVDNLTFLTAGVNNGDTLIYEAFSRVFLCRLRQPTSPI